MSKSENGTGFAERLRRLQPSNTLTLAGDLNLYIPAVTYGEAETCHAAILHHWMYRVAL